MNNSEIDYERLLFDSPSGDIEETMKFLIEKLPDEWCNQYKQMTSHLTNIWRFQVKNFEYLFDDYIELENFGIVPYDPTIESRVVAAFGTSVPMKKPRDSSRLKGWIGSTEQCFGTNSDKGHYIAHSIGGAHEVNIFVQRRDINRGWSQRGKVYRSMEKYCAMNPGTFCFTRPIYEDCSSRPSIIEFGVLTNVRNLWVERF